jgi:hypothetical protein
MLERYKVLGAMLALKQFTVEDLARFSGVNPTTVRTVLNREAKYLHEAGRRATGQPGGQYTRYELDRKHVTLLRSELQELFGQVWATAQAVQDAQNSNVIPLSLLAIEDALLHRYPNARDTQEKRHILNLSTVGLNSSELRGKRLTQKTVGLPAQLTLHLRLARWLNHLATAELAVETGTFPDVHKLARIWREVESSARGFVELGDTELAEVIRRRLLGSPVATRELEAVAAEEQYAITAEVQYVEAGFDTFEVNEASLESEAQRFTTRKC